MFTKILLAIFFVFVFSQKVIVPKYDPIPEFNCVVGDSFKEFIYPEAIVREFDQRRYSISYSNFTTFEVTEGPEGFTFTKETDYGIDSDFTIKHTSPVIGVVRESASSNKAFVLHADGRITFLFRNSDDTFGYFYQDYNLENPVVKLEIKEMGKMFALAGNSIVMIDSSRQISRTHDNVNATDFFISIDDQKTSDKDYLLVTFDDGTMAVLYTNDNGYSFETPKVHTPDNAAVVEVIIVEEYFAVRTENNNVYLYEFTASTKVLNLIQNTSFSNMIKAFAYHPSTTYIYVLVENEGLIALSTDFQTKTNIESGENFENVIKLEISERSGDALLVATCSDGYIMYFVQVSRIGSSNYNAMVLKSEHKLKNIVAAPTSEFEPCSTFFLVRSDTNSSSMDLVRSVNGLVMEGECLEGTNKLEFLIESQDTSEPYHYITNITGVYSSFGLSNQFSFVVLCMILLMYAFIF